MKTIVDMQNEKYFYDHYNMFEYNHDYEKLMTTMTSTITLTSTSM